MSKLTRRTFLQTTAAASAAFPLFTVAGTKASGKVLGANEVIRHGVAGIHGRGKSHMDGFGSIDGVQITYLIDPDSSLFESRAQSVKQKGGNTPKCVQDIRYALDDNDLDTVSIATCNHWHSLLTVWSCQAGKDVYVEKPMSHNVFEGRKCVEAARKYNRVVQHGTQQRSDEKRAREMAAIQKGKYGKLLVARGFCCKPRWSIGYKPYSDPPPELDFNIWLGPALQQEFHANLHPYNWHWFWDFGNGDTGNQGVHQMDVARWSIKDATLPQKVWSLGGRWTPDEEGGRDQGQTPNMQLSVYDFGDALIVFETRGLVGGKMGSPDRIVDNWFYTTEGVIKDKTFYPKNGGKPEPVEGEDVRITPGGNWQAFITAVRSRDPADINGDAETAHYSAALCHLGNIPYRLGQPASMAKKPDILGDNEVVLEAFETLQQNLQDVGLKLDRLTCSVSPVLAFDPKTEQFVGNEEANMLLTRPYREPFVVPENV